MKKTKKLLSMLTALAITASSFAAMVIPASAEPDDPATPTWTLGTESGAGMETIEYQGKSDVLHIIDKNVYTQLQDVATGTVTFNTDVYIDPTVQRSFRIILMNAVSETYSADQAIAQAVVNNGGTVNVGPETANEGSGTVLFTPATAGWYNIDVLVDYSKKDGDEFITVTAKDAEDQQVGQQKIGALSGVDTTLKAIRLVRTASDAYFANMTVTPGSALTPVATPEPDPTEDPNAPTAAPFEGVEYDFEDAADMFTASSDQFGTKLEKVADDTVNTTTVLHGSVSNQSGGRSATLNFPNGYKIDGGNNVISVSYDWYSTAAGNRDGNRNALGTVLIDSSANRILEVSAVDGGTVSVNSNTVEGLASGKWYHVTADIDFETKTIAKVVFADYAAKDTPLATVYHVPFVNDSAANIAGVYFNGVRQSGVNITAEVRLDNFAASDNTDAYFMAHMTVTDKDNAPVADADVTVDGASFKTDAEGKVTVKLEKEGEHDYTVYKLGYSSDGTADGEETLTGKITSATADLELKYSSVPYTPEVTKAEISGGQKVIYAPKDDTPAASAAFEIAVTDQNEEPMTSGFTTAWNVYETGTTTPVTGVTVENGVVSVTKAFNAGEGKDVLLCDVVAVITDSANAEKTVTVKDTINVANDYIVLYDPVTSYTATGAKSVDYSVGDIAVPAEGLHISFTYYKGAFSTAEDTSYGQLDFKDGDTTLFYLKDTNADGVTLYGAEGSSVNLGITERNTPYQIDLTIIGQMVIASFEGGETVVVECPVTPTKITKLTASTSQNGGSGTGATNLLVSTKVSINANSVNVSGDNNVAKVSGKTVTRKYTAKAYVPSEDDNFTWSIAPETAGVSIAADGTLSIADTVAPGKITVTATSGTKTGSMEVTIADFQDLTVAMDGPRAYNNKAGDKGQYVLTSVTDGCGDNLVTEGTVPATAWTSSNTDVATIDAATGELTVVGAGETTVKVTVTNGTKTSSAEIPVTVAEYYITAEATGDSTEIDMSDIVAVDKYLVTTAKDGKVVKQEEVDAPEGVAPSVTKTVAAEAGVKITATYAEGALTSVAEPVAVAAGDEIDMTAAEGSKVFYWKSLASIEPLKTETKTEGGSTGDAKLTVDTTGADSVEVAPIFSAPATDIKTTDERYTFNVPVGTYNIKVQMTGQRADVYANEQILVNNMLQYGATPDTEEVHDIYIKEGYAVINTRDYSSGKTAADSPMSLIEIVKAPSNVTRVPKVYVLGDSLVAKYYNADKSYDLLPNETAEQQKTRFGNMTGWGQVLSHYLTDAVEVVDLANSGADAPGLATTAITQVAESAQKGDYMILESGYNDKGHLNVTEDMMNEAVTQMYNTATAKGATVILVSPNASAHDYNGSVAWAAQMGALATKLNAEYIDLSKLSYDFLYTTCGYGAAYTSTEALSHFYNVYSSGENGLHSTFYNANACAAIVAGEMSKSENAAISGIVNKDATFTFTDPNGATVKLQPDAITFTAPAAPAE